MQILKNTKNMRDALKQARAQHISIGFVPTMGALHEGHAALVRRSLQDGHHALVSIFVNPTQFGPGEDFSRYPRTLDDDARLLEKTGAAFLFAPDVTDIYPEGYATSVQVKGIPDYLDGPSRPGHFDGVATVVAKLFNIVMPDAAYFGEKDWQQLQLIKRMVRDLDMPVAVHGVPTVREEDGLALSSRNRYLSAEERARASLINITLRELAEKMRETPAQAKILLAQATKGLTENGFRVDYLEWADAESCAPAQDIKRPTRLFVAASLGQTRLIDNGPV
jgi:pantoate--beta-alanine ligase